MVELVKTPSSLQAGDAALVNRAGLPEMVVIGTAATTATTAYATAAQGAKADTAVQPAALGGAAALNVGTTAGTVAAGNDARLSDAREWTGATVAQVEAEAGVATTRRAWTAQRVFQAVAAWWAGSADKAKLDGVQAGAQVNAVTSVAARTGAVTLTKADVGLASVDNTADAAKSVASAAALTTARTIALGGDLGGSASFNGSANVTITASVVDDSHNHVIGNVDGLQAALDAKVGSATVDGLERVTAAEYAALTPPVATTLYVVVG